MLSRPILLLLLSIALPLWPSARAVSATPEPCEVSVDLTAPNNPLEHLAEALDAGKPINILAVGSGTTVGETNGTPGSSFPFRMVEALRLTRPNVAFQLTVRGARNMTAEAMLPLLTDAVRTQYYPLVLWQTGTVEAVRGMRPDLMQAVLEAGIDAVSDAGGDVVLIDPQFSRFLRANTDLDPYESVLAQVSGIPGVALFHRFDVMRTWATEGHLDLERVRKSDRDAAIVQLNNCLGQTLARFVLNGAAAGQH